MSEILVIIVVFSYGRWPSEVAIIFIIVNQIEIQMSTYLIRYSERLLSPSFLPHSKTDKRAKKVRYDSRKKVNQKLNVCAISFS